MSSGYFGEFVTASFKYTMSDNFRKKFVTPEDETRFMDSARTSAILRLSGFHSEIRDILKSVNQAVGEFDLNLPRLDIGHVEDLKKVDERAFPLNIQFLVNGSDRSNEYLELTIKTRKGIDGLATAVGKLRKCFTSAPQEEPPHPLNFARTQIARTRFSETFGVYVGTAAEVERDSVARIESNMGKIMDRLYPFIEKRLNNPKDYEKLGITGKRKSLRPVLEKRGYKDLAMGFNPFGPLVDSDGSGQEIIRTSKERGGVKVIVAVAPEKYDWGKFNIELSSWLKLFFEDDHSRLIAKEGALLELEKKDLNTSLVYQILEQYKANRDERFIKIVTGYFLDQERINLHEPALKFINETQEPGRKLTLMRYLENLKRVDPTVGGAVVEALVRNPERDVIDKMISIWTKTDLDWNIRYRARDTMKAMAEKMADGDPLKKLIEQGVAAAE